MRYILFCFVFFMMPAHAVSVGNAIFNGSILSACNVSNFVDGTIVANSGTTELSSITAGGSPATFTVSTTGGGYRLTYGTPTLTGPSGSVSGATYTVTSSATGTGLLGAVISLINQVGSVLSLNLGGTYAVTVNARATLSSGAFEAGTYRLTVPVSCSL
jgi:hypothetical protein